jgi:hypothetical protein
MPQETHQNGGDKHEREMFDAFIFAWDQLVGGELKNRGWAYVYAFYQYQA